MSTSRRKYRLGALVVAVVASLSCSDGGGSSDHHTSIAGTVWWSGPVEGAAVDAYQVLPSG